MAQIDFSAQIQVRKVESNCHGAVVVGAGISGLIAAGADARRDRTRIVYRRIWMAKITRRTASIRGARIEPGHRIFCQMARLAGCWFEEDISTARYLSSILGGFQSVALAPGSLWSAEPCNEISTLIVGVRGPSSFDENFMAERLSEQTRTISPSCTYTAGQISLSSDLETPVTALRIAKCFDRNPGFCDEPGGDLRSTASGFSRPFVPGILGLDSSAERIAQFENEVGRSVCEIPTLPPSNSGLRIFHSSESYLLAAGLELYRGFPVEIVEVHDGSA
jgi:anaerobic glycerol-3-phosphate dehydrogenase